MSEVSAMPAMRISLFGSKYIAVSFREPHGIRSITFKAPLVTSGSFWDGIPEFARRITEALFEIQGVTVVDWDRSYEMSVRKADVFTWEELLPAVIPVLVEHLSPEQRLQVIVPERAFENRLQELIRKLLGQVPASDAETTNEVVEPDDAGDAEEIVLEEEPEATGDSDGGPEADGIDRSTPLGDWPKDTYSDEEERALPPAWWRQKWWRRGSGITRSTSHLESHRYWP